MSIHANSESEKKSLPETFLKKIGRWNQGNKSGKRGNKSVTKSLHYLQNRELEVEVKCADFICPQLCSWPEWCWRTQAHHQTVAKTGMINSHVFSFVTIDFDFCQKACACNSDEHIEIS